MAYSEETLREIALKEKLFSLGDFDLCKFGDKNSLQVLSLAEATRQRIKASGSAEWDWITTDLINAASSNIVFSLKNVFYYLPGINNLAREYVEDSDYGLILPTYHQTTSDLRYLYYVSVTFEKLYAYWDRIGDLFDLVFDVIKNKDGIYFPVVVDALTAKFKSQSANMQWLQDFAKNEYSQSLNKYRKRIVHIRSLNQDFLEGVLTANFREKEECLKYLDGLQKEREGFALLLKDQLHLTIVGFECAINLINELEPLANIRAD